MRACGVGIDGTTRTVRTDVNNVLATLPSASTQSQIGRLFSAPANTVLSTTVIAGTTIITNPPTLGRIMYIDSIYGGTTLSPAVAPSQALTFDSSVDINFILDPATGPFNLLIRNLNFGSSEMSEMSATFFLGDLSGDTVGRSTQVLGPFSFDIAGKIIVPPNHSFGVQLMALIQQPNPNAIVANLTVTWYELDLP